MALICSGERTKAEVLNETIEEYKEMYMKTKQHKNTLVESVREFIEGNGAGPAPPVAQGGQAGHGGGGHGGNNGEDDDDDSDGDGGNGRPAARGGRGGSNGGRGGRGGGSASAPAARQTAPRAAPVHAQIPRGEPATRGGRGGGAPPAGGRRPFPKNDDNDENNDGGQGKEGFANQAQWSRHINWFDMISMSTGPFCNCQQASIERTVYKEGPNTGRKFWTCPKPQGEGCGFFEWQDSSSTAGGDGGGGYSRTVPKKRTAANIVSRAYPLRCFSDIP